MTAKPIAMETVRESITSMLQRPISARAAWRAVSTVPEKPADRWIERICSVSAANRS